MDAVTQVPAPVNEPVLDYAPGSPERASLEVALAELGSTRVDLPHTIAGKRVMGTGKKIDVRQPHAKRKILGTLRNATVQDAQAAVDAAKAAAPGWRELSFDDRAAVLLKAAELLSGPWRARLNAATMLGQSQDRLPGRDRRGLRAHRLLAHQRPLRPADPRRAAAAQLQGHLEPHRPPAARGLRLRDHAVQLHRHRRQPADGSGAHGQHRRLEALADAAVRRAGRPWSCSRRPACRPVSSTWSPATASTSPRWRWPTPTSRASTSPARPRPSSTCGRRSAPTCRATAPTRASSARPAARTSSSPTRQPTPTCCAPR